MEANLDQFLEQLLEDKGLTSLEGDVREEVKVDMANRILDQIDQACINALSEEQAAELAEKVDDENFGQKEMLDFIANCGIDTTAIVTGVLIQFRAFYLNGGIPATEKADNKEVTEA